MRTASYPRSHPQRASLGEQLLVAGLMGLLLFLIGFFILMVGYQLSHAGTIYPGVRVAGIDFGGMTQDEAAARLTENFSYPRTGRVLFQDGAKVWLVTPGDMGLYLDPEQTIQRAYQVGRAGGLTRRLREQFDTWYYGVDLSPAFVLDQRTGRQFLSSIAAEIDRPVLEAALEINGADVVVRSGETGRTLDIDATLLLLSEQLARLQDGIIPLVITETPPQIVDAAPQAELARTILSKSLTLSLPKEEAGEAGPWVIEPQTLAGMLSIQRVTDGPASEYRIGLNASLIRTYLSNLAPNVDIQPHNARFIFNDDTHILDVLEKSVTGRTLDVEASISKIEEQLLAGKHSVGLVFNHQKPAVEDTAKGEDLGITELVHAQTSYFYGSNASRVQNIQAAASRFHGLLIPPGETFSMASALGDISLDNGYAEAMIILGGRTIKGVGGGVCQVSTTLFRAAFFGGYPIVERHAHAYRVYYYEKVAGNEIDSSLAGLDATVFVPLVDFKFRNDTPHWLLMETYVVPENASITWKFYSTKDGRTVEWDTTGPMNIVEPPEPEYIENPDLAKDEIKQVDWQAQGADVTVTRTVLKDGGVYLQDTIFTQYQPWPDMFEYGPGSELPEPDSDAEE